MKQETKSLGMLLLVFVFMLCLMVKCSGQCKEVRGHVREEIKKVFGDSVGADGQLKWGSYLTYGNDTALIEGNFWHRFKVGDTLGVTGVNNGLVLKELGRYSVGGRIVGRVYKVKSGKGIDSVRVGEGEYYEGGDMVGVTRVRKLKNK